MKLIALTGPQQTQAEANKAVLATARAAFQAAQQAHLNYLRSIAAAGSPPVPASARVQLTDDCCSIIVS
jgi:hypothetical protein